MARKVPNGPVAIPEEAKKKSINAMTRRAVESGIVRGSTILMFFWNRRGKRFNVQASAQRTVAFATAEQLICKGCTPG